VLAALHDTLPGDTGIARWGQNLPFPGKHLSDFVRDLTGTEVVMGAGFAIAIALWLRGQRMPAVLLAAGLVVLPLLQTGLKEAVDRPRPSAEIVEIRGGFSSPSFPSGHVMSGTFLYGFLLYASLALPLLPMARYLLAALAVFFLALGGPANVYLGVHWPSDVLGGWAWSFVILGPLILMDRRARTGASRDR
jgi:undecaprenyl-diphosphatase